MPKTKAEIFETNEVEPDPVAETKKVKTKKVISAERLEELKAQLARGRATKLAKKEALKPKTETKEEVPEVSKPTPTNTDELAELRNEIKSLKEKMTTPISIPKKEVAPVQSVAPPISIQKKEVAPPISIPKKEVAPPAPKKIIYSAFKVASW